MVRRGIVFAAALTSLGLAIACSSEGDAPGTASSDKPAATATAKTVTPAMVERGHAIYKTNCVPCHGESGKGDGPGAGVLNPKPRDHTDYAYMSTLTDKEVADVIKMGGAIKGRPLMPSHPQITGTDMDALVGFIRTLSAPNNPNK
jgi:mono/diheme cytochrome c family protein